jgi:bifunctional ADP-heptose synthase (sugar kinase/adenylyltransferase)
MRLDAVKDYRVLVVGDAIRDRYVFVKPLGKSAKESVLALGYEREEVYRGGVWAAAAHLAGLCAHVDVMHGPRVMHSTRFVEGPGNRKLFTLHEAQQEPARGGFNARDYDLVIVADFGYGTMTPELIEQVSRDARYLAVNAQTNSNNFGFNLITRYARADYVVIDELEARLAAQDRTSDIEQVIRKLGFPKIVVTLGSQGAVGFDREFYREPAQADRVVDTMGAGDAFLVVSAVFAKAMYSIRELVHVGNLAGAAKVGVVGHRRPIERKELEDGPRD